jgi:hypothetical protein
MYSRALNHEQLDIQASCILEFSSLDNEMERLEQGLENDRYNIELFNSVPALGRALLTSTGISANSLLALRTKHARLIELYNCLVKFHQIDYEFVELESELHSSGNFPTVQCLLRIQNLLLSLHSSSQLTDRDRVQLHNRHAHMLAFCESKAYILDFHVNTINLSDIGHDSSYGSDSDNSNSEEEVVWEYDSDNEWGPGPSSHHMQRG